MGRTFSGFWVEENSGKLGFKSGKIRGKKLSKSKMGSIIGHRIDYNGVGVLKGQRHITSKN